MSDGGGAPPDGAAGPRPAVMIVDDCVATRRLVRLALEREGHVMPQVTGMELHAHVLALDPAQAGRMVFLTGSAFTLDARTFLDGTPNARVEKPFLIAELKRLVNALVAVP